MPYEVEPIENQPCESDFQRASLLRRSILDFGQAPLPSSRVGSHFPTPFPVWKGLRRAGVVDKKLTGGVIAIAAAGLCERRRPCGTGTNGGTPPFPGVFLPRSIAEYC